MQNISKIPSTSLRFAPFDLNPTRYKANLSERAQDITPVMIRLSVRPPMAYAVKRKLTLIFGQQLLVFAEVLRDLATRLAVDQKIILPKRITPILFF